MICAPFEEETYRKAAEQVLQNAHEILPCGLATLIVGLILLTLSVFFIYLESKASLHKSYIGRFLICFLIGFVSSLAGLSMVCEHAQAKKNPEYFVIQKLNH